MSRSRSGRCALAGRRRRPRAALPLLLAAGLLVLSCRPEAISRIEPATLAQVPVDLSLRVQLAAAAEQIELAVHSPYQIRDTRGRIIIDSAAPLDPCQASAGRADALGVSIGSRALSPETVEVVPATDGAVRVGHRRYRGYVRLAAGPDGLRVVNVVHVESYLRGVLCGELPRWFDRRTFRAQAVAARTYALYQKLVASKRRRYDVLATEASQVYLGLNGETRKAIDAVEYTRGIVLTWNSPAGPKIFSTYYSSTCGGMTQSIANCKNEPPIPPLAGGVICRHCHSSPHYNWPALRLTKQYITEHLQQRFEHLADIRRIDRIEILKQTRDGRAVRLALTDAAGRRFELRAEDFRLAVGGNRLKSTRCRIVTEPDAFVFADGRGFGHGVGLCQYGAEGMARAGATSAQILQHYYPQSRLSKAYD